MIEYVLLSLPSFVAGGFALAWWRERSTRRTTHVRNVALRATVAEAVNDPAKFQARVGGVGRAGARDARLNAIRERRKADRAQRKAE